jgi:hypothetical protein
MHQISPVAVPLVLSHPEERLFGLFFWFCYLRVFRDIDGEPI